jgi:hypothetical protein
VITTDQLEVVQELAAKIVAGTSSWLGRQRISLFRQASAVGLGGLANVRR